MNTTAHAQPRRNSFLKAQLSADLRSITRNSLLALLTVMPLITALIYHFAIPDEETLGQLAGQRFSVELEQFRPLIETGLLNLHALLMAIFVGLSASMIGAVYGLLLVEEREERILPSVRVMPVRFSSYVAVRMALPMATATIMTALAYPIAGMAPLPAGTVLAIAAAGATLAPVITLAIVAFAPGRVAALALVRLFSLLAVIPFIAWFIAPPGEWAFAPIGSYWQMRALWSAMEGGAILPDLLAVIAVNGALSIFFYSRLAARSE